MPDERKDDVRVHREETNIASWVEAIKQEGGDWRILFSHEAYNGPVPEVYSGYRPETVDMSGHIFSAALGEKSRLQREMMDIVTDRFSPDIYQDSRGLTRGRRLFAVVPSGKDESKCEVAYLVNDGVDRYSKVGFQVRLTKGVARKLISAIEMDPCLLDKLMYRLCPGIVSWPEPGEEILVSVRWRNGLGRLVEKDSEQTIQMTGQEFDPESEISNTRKKELGEMAAFFAAFHMLGGISQRQQSLGDWGSRCPLEMDGKGCINLFNFMYLEALFSTGKEGPNLGEPAYRRLKDLFETMKKRFPNVVATSDQVDGHNGSHITSFEPWKARDILTPQEYAFFLRRALMINRGKFGDSLREVFGVHESMKEK